MTKSKNKWNAVSAIVFSLIALLALMTLSSIKAHAYGPGGGYQDYESWQDDYPINGCAIWVGDTMVTTENKDNIPGVIGGKAYIDKKGNLVFENVTGVTGLHRGAQIYAERDITIKGTATLTNPDADYGILMNSMDFEDPEAPSDLTFDGVNTNIKVSGKKRGVYACSITMLNGKVEASGRVEGLSLCHRALFYAGNFTAYGPTNSIEELFYVFGGGFSAEGYGSGQPALKVDEIQNKGGDLVFTARGSNSYGLELRGLYNYSGSLDAVGTAGAIKSKYYYVGYESDLQNADIRGEFRKIVSKTEGENPKHVLIKRAPSGEVRYPVWIGDTVVTSKNMKDIPGVLSGKASYDPSTNTLTLTNVSGVKGLHNGAQIFIDKSMKVRGTGILIDLNAEYGIAGYWPDEPWFLNDAPSLDFNGCNIIACGDAAGYYQVDWPEDWYTLYSIQGNTYTFAADDFLVETLEALDLEKMGFTWSYNYNKTRIYLTRKDNQLLGTASLSGSLIYGATLKAVPSGMNATNLAYKWKRGNTVISGATGKSYKLKAEDIGKKITCEITDKDGKKQGVIKAVTKSTIQKAEGPEAPTGLKATKCTAGSKNGTITNVTKDMEYATKSDFSNAKVCSGTKITGLAKGTYYVRYKETSTHKAGKSASVKVTEKPADVTTVFTDIPKSAGYVKAVQYVYDRKIMTGTGKNTFSPNAGMTRGEFITILYGIAGKPTPKNTISLSDVKKTDACYNAVRWALENKISTGQTSTTFGVNTVITRQEMMTFLYRYAKLKNYDINVNSKALDNYTDKSKVSNYAQTPMKWAVTKGIMVGSTTANGKTLNPTGKTTRSMTATVLMRFMTTVVK